MANTSMEKTQTEISEILIHIIIIEDCLVKHDFYRNYFLIGMIVNAVAIFDKEGVTVSCFFVHEDKRILH